ncbi:Putative metal-sulfur cluster biosynthesis proteins YuaD [Sulfitobacter sp. THAF37]|uniref:MOSC domain-containing protein n=1 Tax=Sulfitobacter sp. THAF37 TaxID=2587855 RepID=UPI0012680787|nr:MOSC domain-containing protein [Sulfitobacter sp. THAF37]QFT59098.1 Putative metal-sulfur cluster biosynthesis proteins YuaD [Sulfitobacter sp. THAF37]
MPELLPTDHVGTILWMGMVPQNRENIRSQALDRARATHAGFEGDFHAGLTRPSCVRVKAQYPQGTEIRNTRQFSILSAEEMAEIAAEIGVDTLDPRLLGASIVVQGIPDFTHIPPSSRLQSESGTTLTVDMLNGPCNLPAREIEKEAEGHGKGFKAAAMGKRGVTAWVEREGDLAVGDSLRLHVPAQRAWAPE